MANVEAEFRKQRGSGFCRRQIPQETTTIPPTPQVLTELCPAPGLAGSDRRHPLDPRLAVIAGGLEVHGPTPAPGAGGSGN